MAFVAAPVAAPVTDLTVLPMPIEPSTPLIVWPRSTGGFGRPGEEDGDCPAATGPERDPAAFALLLSGAPRGLLDGFSLHAFVCGPLYVTP